MSLLLFLTVYMFGAALPRMLADEELEVNIKNDLLNQYITPVLTVSSGEVYK